MVLVICLATDMLDWILTPNNQLAQGEIIKQALRKDERILSILIIQPPVQQCVREALTKKNIESLTAVKPEGRGWVSGLVVIVLRFFFAMLQTYLCGLRKPQNTFCGHSQTPYSLSLPSYLTL